MGSRTKSKVRGPRLVKARPPEIKLDLACGQKALDGFEGVDLFAPNAKHKFDLLKFPWPIASDSVGEIHCSHFIEHIPMCYVDNHGKLGFLPSEGEDLFFRFFDEVYRVMHKEAVAKFVWPSSRSNRAYQDPTHRRFIPQEAMLYLNADWRKANALDHGPYAIKCHFVGDCVHSCFSELMALAPEVQARRFNEGWNTTIDFIATLKPVKKPVK